jgi:phosphoribosylanthranilate isomerase
MFQIKICGITNEDDAKMVVEAGADAMGLNFYPQSTRFISQDVAARILQVIPLEIVKVGLFVNEAVEVVKKAYESLGLDLIQLHGDEPPEYLLRLADRPVMKVFRLAAEGLPLIEAYLERYRELSRTGLQPISNSGTGLHPVLNHSSNIRQVENLSYILLDSHLKGVYGGSGVTGNWAVSAQLVKQLNYPPVILAGGLTPENVTQAIREVRPAGVDTASGVESRPGRKDRRLVAAFVKNARTAFLSKDG